MFDKATDFLIFCLWIWILTIAYYFNFIKFSLLYSSFFALLFTIYNTLFVINNNSLMNKINIILIEVFVLIVNVKKHFFIDKKKLILINDIIFNIILFIVYLLFLSLLGTNFYKLYFIKYRKV